MWLARNRALGEYRAVKIVRVQSKHLFAREFEGLRKYAPVSRTNPSLLSILHVGKNEADGDLYYIMDLADDREAARELDPHRYEPKTLASELKLRKRLPLRECVQIGLALTSAVKHLHNHGLVHRDIKPANSVFPRGQPKLADVGLVATDDQQYFGGGTPGYIPPEGHGRPQGDIFSLGKVLYETCTGKECSDFPEPPTDLEESPDHTLWLALNKLILNFGMKVAAPSVGELDIRRLAADVARELAAQRVILFGSQATGRAHPDSDVDLLVIVERPLSAEISARRTEAIRADFPVPVQIVAMSADEFLETKDVVGGLAYPAAHGGRVVYEEP